MAKEEKRLLEKDADKNEEKIEEVKGEKVEVVEDTDNTKQDDKKSEKVSKAEESKDMKDTENVKEEKVEQKTEVVKPDKKSEDKEEKPAETSKTEESKDVKDTKEDKKEAPKEEPKKKNERIAVLNIYTTFNNTIMNLTDMSGNCIAKYSGGQSTKQDRLKANPTIAMFIAQRVAEEARDNGITGFYVKIRAATGQANPGPGAHSAIKSLTRAGFKILGIMDSTKIARGGPKKKGGRRGRRP